LKHHFPILVGAALLLAPLAVSAQSSPPQATSFAMLCVGSIRGQVFNEILEVDTLATRVNGSPAVFAAPLMTWRTVDYDQYFKRMTSTRHELNQIVRTYRRWSEDGITTEPGPTFRCEETPAQTL
jgi:hypothetical protein